MIFPPRAESPEPWDPDEGLEARLNASYDAAAARQAAERRQQFDRTYNLLHPPPETRHTGSDGGLHHRPWDDPAAAGDGRSAELDMLARQRDADPLTAHERGEDAAREAMGLPPKIRDPRPDDFEPGGRMWRSRELIEIEIRMHEQGIAGIGHEPGYPR